MLRDALRKLAHLAVHRPWAILAVCTVVPALLGLTLFRVPVDLSFTGIMDRSNPQVALYFDVSKQYNLGGTLLVLLEALEGTTEEKLDTVAERLTEVLNEHPEVRSVLPPVPDQWLLDRAPWLVDRPTFDAWVRAVEDPSDAKARNVLQANLVQRQEEWQSAKIEGARLLQVALVNDPLDEGLGSQTFFVLRDVIEAEATRINASTPGGGVDVSYAGMPAVGAEDQSRTLGIIRKLTPLSFVLVLILFRFVERRLSGLFIVGLPLLLSVVATLGVIGLITGRLTVMETFFGVMVFGLGIDFAIHLLVRQREERARGLSLEQALQANLVGTGRGIVAGGFTTAAAFFVVAMAPDPIALHLGLSGGTGLVLCLVFMLALLPAMWSILERRRSARPHSKASAEPARRLEVPLLAEIAGWSVRRSGLTLMLSLAVLLLALAGLPRLRTETNINKVFNRKVPSVETVERVRERFQLSGAPWIIGTETVAEADRISRELLASDRFHRTLSASSFVSQDERDKFERQAELERIQPAVAQRLQGLAVAAGLGGAADVVRLGLEPLQHALEVGAPTIESLPEGLRQRLIAQNGDFLVLAYARGDTFDSRGAALDREVAQAIAPRATSISALLEAIMLGDRPWILWVAVSIVLVVCGTLMLDFRDPRMALLALVPVVFGLCVTIGVLCWAGVAFNIMTITVAPLIIGLGVDDGIHVVHRIKEDRSVPIEVATAAVGRAIVMTTATTCSSFGVLMFSDHPGIESMALVMLIGLPVCLLASITALPALAQRILQPMPPDAGR